MILDKVNFVSIPRTATNAIHGLVGQENNHHSIKLTKDERFSFAVIRNPIQRLISWWKYHSNTIYDPTGEIYGNDFSEWVRRGCKHHWSSEFCESHGVSTPLNQWEFVCDDDGNILVDRLINFDDLQNQFTQTLSPYTKNTTLQVKNMSPADKTPSVSKLTNKAIKDMFGFDFHIYNSLNLK